MKQRQFNSARLIATEPKVPRHGVTSLRPRNSQTQLARTPSPKARSTAIAIPASGISPLSEKGRKRLYIPNTECSRMHYLKSARRAIKLRVTKDQLRSRRVVALTGILRSRFQNRPVGASHFFPRCAQQLACSLLSFRTQRPWASSLEPGLRRRGSGCYGSTLIWMFLN
jgi:hypothetical protein